MTIPVLKINDHATGGRRTKDILGGPKGWGPKKKVANVEIYVIFEVFAFCGGRTKTDFKDRAGCGGQWWCCWLTAWSVVPLLLLLLWPKAFGGDAGSTAQCSTAHGIERDRTSKDHQVCLRSLTIPLKVDHPAHTLNLSLLTILSIEV